MLRALQKAQTFYLLNRYIMNNNISFRFLTLFMVVALSIGVASCSKDDDGEPSLLITEDMLAGTWKVTAIHGNNPFSGYLAVGDVTTFSAGGTCQGFHWMENSYRIKGGRLYTYYAETKEPIAVYTLLSEDGRKVTMKMNGTLDEAALTCTLILEREE